MWTLNGMLKNFFVSVIYITIYGVTFHCIRQQPHHAVLTFHILFLLPSEIVSFFFRSIFSLVYHGILPSSQMGFAATSVLHHRSALPFPCAYHGRNQSSTTRRALSLCAQDLRWECAIVAKPVQLLSRQLPRDPFMGKGGEVRRGTVRQGSAQCFMLNCPGYLYRHDFFFMTQSVFILSCIAA